MKTKSVFFSLATLIFLSVISFFACEDVVKETKLCYVPEYMTLDEFRSAVKATQPEALSQPGKIYFKDGYLFINEVSKGIHIIDNTSPANPQKITFISIPGNNDLAIKGSILYANSYTDLVAIDISDLQNINEVNRLDSVFIYYFPELPSYEYDILTKEDEPLLITGWKLEEVTKEKEKTNYYNYNRRNIDVLFDAIQSNSAGVFSQSSGVGGSMGRFTIKNNYLYIVQESDMNVIDISKLNNPKPITTINVGWGLETIFQYKSNLFIGSQTGMYIYGLADPTSPDRLSLFSHLTSCDPLVVDDNFAYVTLRSGNLCRNGNNQLDVIDISDLTGPTLVKSYNMSNPHGLGIDDKVLFICDGNAGLKIYNASDPLKIKDNNIAVYSEVNAYDVIPLDGILMLTATDGIYQYNYSDLEDIKFLSKIDIEEE